MGQAVNLKVEDDVKDENDSGYDSDGAVAVAGGSQAGGRAGGGGGRGRGVVKNEGDGAEEEVGQIKREGEDDAERRRMMGARLKLSMKTRRRSKSPWIWLRRSSC